MWGKIIIPMYRLWLSGLYGLYGPRCPLSPKRLINLISPSLSLSLWRHFKNRMETRKHAQWTHDVVMSRLRQTMLRRSFAVIMTSLLRPVFAAWLHLYPQVMLFAVRLIAIKRNIFAHLHAKYQHIGLQAITPRMVELQKYMIFVKGW